MTQSQHTLHSVANMRMMSADSLLTMVIVFLSNRTGTCTTMLPSTNHESSTPRSSTRVNEMVVLGWLACTHKWQPSQLPLPQKQSAQATDEEGHLLVIAHHTMLRTHCRSCSTPKHNDKGSCQDLAKHCVHHHADVLRTLYTHTTAALLMLTALYTTTGIMPQKQIVHGYNVLYSTMQSFGQHTDFSLELCFSYSSRMNCRPPLAVSGVQPGVSGWNCQPLSGWRR